jgi:hypothetical protein
MGEIFHFTETLINLGKLVRNELETVIEAFFDGLLKFLVDREAHFFKFFVIVVLEKLYTGVECATDGLEVIRDFFTVFAEFGFDLGCEFVECAFDPNQALFETTSIETSDGFTEEVEEEQDDGDDK